MIPGRPPLYNKISIHVLSDSHIMAESLSKEKEASLQNCTLDQQFVHAVSAIPLQFQWQLFCLEEL